MELTGSNMWRTLELYEGFVCPYCRVKFSRTLHYEGHWLRAHRQAMAMLYYEEAGRVPPQNSSLSSSSSMPSEVHSQSHTFRNKAFKRPRSCDLCQQPIKEQGSSCRVCKYACHRECESKVIAACEPLVNYELHSQGLRQAQGRRSRSPGSRSLDRGRSPRSYERPSSFMMDIVYVTERIIVVTFPEAGTNAVYKNNLKEVTQMLRTKHGNKYKVFNLSEKREDLTKLNPQVLDFGWPPHLAPSLERLCGICKALDAWLTSNPHHIAVIHSKGDKGRTGVVIAAYMHYSSICASADQALDRFAMKRFYDDKLAGTMHPSQKRYIHYFSGLLSGAIKLNNCPLYLHHIIVHGVPNFDAKGGCKPFFKIYQGMHPVYTSGVYLVTERARRIIVTLEPSLQLRGDVLVKAYHKKIQPASRVVIFRVQFHTCTLESSRLSFVKEDLDDALYDSRFPDDGRVEFQFSYRPDDYKGNGSIHDAVVPVDNTLDSLVKWDSYETFDMMHDDAGVPHTEGPLDGSLYATVTKKWSPVPSTSPSQPSQTNHDNLSDVDGPHLSMDSGISSTSGLQGTAHSPLPSSSSRQQPQLSNGSNGFSSPTTVEVEVHHVSDFGHVPNDSSFSKDEQAQLDELLDGMLKEIQSIPDILPSASSAQFQSRPHVPHHSVAKATPAPAYHPVAMVTPGPAYHSAASSSSDYAVPRAPREVTHIYSSPPLNVVSVNGTKQSVVPAPLHIKSTSWTAESPSSPSPYQTPKNTCRGSTTFSQVISSGSPKSVQRSMPKHNSLPSSLEYHRKAQEMMAAETLRDVSSSPESKRHSDESSLTWLQRQQQKLRARKEGWEDRHHKEQKLIVELQSAQSRKASHGSDSDGVLDLSSPTHGSPPKLLNFAMPLHVNTCSSYSPTPQSPPSSSYTTAKTPTSRGLSAPTSPIIPSRSSSKDVTRSRFQQWHSHHRPLVRQRSDTSYDRERPFVSGRQTNTQEQSTATEQMVGTPTVYSTVHPYSYRHIYPQSHSLPPQVSLTATMSPALPPTPGRTADPLSPAVHREQRTASPPISIGGDTSGLLTLMDSRHPSKAQTSTPQAPGPVSPASSKLDELEQSLQALSSSSRSPTHSPQPPLYGQHSPVHYAHSTPAKAGTAIANGVAPWSPAIASSSPSASPRSSDRPITPAFPVTSHTPYVNQDSPNIGAGLPPKSPPTSRKEHSPSPVAQPSLHQGSVSQPGGPHIMNGQGSPIPHYVQSQRSSVLSLTEPTDVIHHHPVFVKDISKFWYKPTITREEAINMLKDKPPGSFVVRDSNSFPGAFGIALKVATPPPSVQHKTGDISNELVRHFLIEPTAKGVRLKGCPNEPIFGSLSALVYQHSITPLALPCKLLLPESDPAGDSTDYHMAGSSSSNSVLNQGAACNVLYLLSVEMESLTGPQAIRKALSYLLDMKPPPLPTVVHFKVTAQGITLTDNKRKLFFRRHYQMNNISHCGLDPDHRQWAPYGENSDYPPGSSRFFGFIARKPASKTDNQCHVFAELEPGQPASAIVNFVNKIMMTLGQQKNRLNLI